MEAGRTSPFDLRSHPAASLRRSLRYPAKMGNMSEAVMSQIYSGILGGLVVLTLGAVQFASGRDLGGVSPGIDVTSANSINRAAKSDRANVQVSSSQGETVSIRLDGMSDTSILVRIPGGHLREEARNRQPDPSSIKTPVMVKKQTVACEPVVSVLTEVAKQLEPGRCFT